MKKLIFAGAAALAFSSAPAIAQDVAVASDGSVYVLTDAQKVMYDGWPATYRTSYDAWPYGVQEYYWTLTPAQTEGWWMLSDPQRVQIFEMTPDARVVAWNQIAAQMAGTTTANVATTAAASASTSSPRFVSGAVVQSTPAAYTPAGEGKDLPICKPNQQDGCINGWEKNRTGNRPLNYWPGKPASEIPGKLPANQ